MHSLLLTRLAAPADLQLRVLGQGVGGVDEHLAADVRAQAGGHLADLVVAVRTFKGGGGAAYGPYHGGEWVSGGTLFGRCLQLTEPMAPRHGLRHELTCMCRTAQIPGQGLAVGSVRACDARNEHVGTWAGSTAGVHMGMYLLVVARMTTSEVLTVSAMLATLLLESFARSAYLPARGDTHKMHGVSSSWDQQHESQAGYL